MPRCRSIVAALPCVALLGLALPAHAADSNREAIQAQVDRQYPSLDALYVHLHSNPELSHQETATAKRIAEELRAAGYEVTEGVAGGVVGVLRNGPGKTLLLRTELDGLPVKEQTGAAYASTATATNPAGQVVPVMHACAHDMHMTSLVGAARALAALKDRWSGTLVLVGQPAEETVGGAKAMLEDGLYERFPRPDFAIAQHVDAELPAGKVGFVSGFSFATVDTVDILIKGIGGHGAWPHTTKDPIVVAAQTILNLQTIASREIKPIAPVVITVGSIHGGTKHNIIPDEVALQVTVRTYEDDVRDQVLTAIERIVKGTAATAGIPAEREPVVTRRANESTFATYNTPELVERVVAGLRKSLGEDNVVQGEPGMGSEDFGLFGRTTPKVPIFLYRLGTVDPEQHAAFKVGKVRLPSLHSSTYLPAKEASLRTGVTSMTAIALDLLGKTKP